MGAATYTKTFIICPYCEAETNSVVSHLFGKGGYESFGPWNCDACGQWYEGSVSKDDNVELRPCSYRKPTVPVWTLLKFLGADHPVYFVLKSDADADQDIAEMNDSKEYFYEEHSCPTNWIGDTVCIIENGDADPHGFLEFVRAAFVPKDADPDDQMAVLSVFPEAFGDGAVIDGEVSLSIKALPAADKPDPR